MFMPNILSYFIVKLIKQNKTPSARATSSKALGERAVGTALGRVLGGGPPGPSGGALCALVPPRGGWGAEKAAFSTV